MRQDLVWFVRPVSIVPWNFVIAVTAYPYATAQSSVLSSAERKSEFEEATKMNMPGFTAEAALYKAVETYEAAAISDGLAERRGVEPQFWSCHGNYCCQDLAGGLYCIYRGPVLQ